MLKTNSRLLAITSCLALAISLQAYAVPDLERPRSVALEATAPAAPCAVELDQEIEAKVDKKVIATGCTDSCCDGKTTSGNAVCCPKRVTTEVKKHCWKVKSETICIPGFRFKCNWKKRGKKSCDCGETCCSNGSVCDCPPKCGRVRCIKVLEKHETTCDKCGYEWEVKSVGNGTDRCCDGRSDCPSCGCATE